ncbi:MAG: hypothetical protein HYV09_28530 [Deltaproteobacteria bacterium]|nr:hypothetical protein [Deltaproteobacteria bacterium]
MAAVVLRVAGFRCERCAHEWIPRQPRNLPPVRGKKDVPKPRICPRCKSAWWDTPRRVK